MTPETNAALSGAMREMNLDEYVGRLSPHSLAARELQALRANVEASQREAPVAEDFIDKFLSQMSHTEVGGVPMDYWDRTLTLQFVEDVRRRLAEGPSVTNVNPEAISAVLYANSTDESDDGKWIEEKDYYKIAALIEALQLPAPGKAADDVFLSASDLEQILDLLDYILNVPEGTRLKTRKDEAGIVLRNRVKAALASLKGGR